MPPPNPAALDFLLTRRSRPAKTLTAPVPTREDLLPILTAALRSPDHGKLEPWRLIVLERAALMRLAELVGERGKALGRTPEEIDKQRLQYADGGLAVAVIASPVDSPKVPHIEQILSAGAVCLSLVNAALASGWGANWLSGWASHDRVFMANGLGLAEHEMVAGLIHIGTETTPPPDRPRPDLDTKVDWVTQ
ncbi:Putative NAD(P)H nitroreductase YdjA [Rhodobacteraceae bacterium THAF1]|uniref:nitroreductase family protein n=1 Tax=Palleronia sp. THAF1 TaxID=2587842 RepID=UPI000F3F8BA2|nr:nitroreductase [Palleronia sp. THAF1]QFU07364.1 Putative NAD(P)H nitroreductase YdjA [Palleronia sp. THAF1]VDC20724.1 Putative NAD(P)H nitroreductase YdjA [Rhodobacteraceae bacterium THAF1]